MTSSVSHLTFDAHDAFAQATWWAQVLGGTSARTTSQETPRLRCSVPATPLLFINVPESKSVKNRAHLDLQPEDRSRDEEVERVIGLGATFFDDQRLPDGAGWVVLTDPEGNEFCILRSLAERAG